METKRYEIETARLSVSFEGGERLRLRQIKADGREWLSAADSGGFAVYADDLRLDARDLRLDDFRVEAADGVQHVVASLSGGNLRVEQHVQIYDNTALLEQWLVVRTTAPQRITRVDSLALKIAPGAYDLLHFDSDWGQEFDPVRAALNDAVTLETRLGRASKGQHPYFALLATPGVIAGSVSWSGNWCLRFEPADDGVLISGGLHDWAFEKTLAMGEALESPRVVLAFGSSLDETARQFARVGRRWWIPHNALSSALPVEWNHWWSYEDVEIDETVFRANAAAAAALGVELCTLDAGWFGVSHAGSGEVGVGWHDLRGDWELVNAARFPSGIRALADEVHALGMKFGLWCEIEGLGPRAALSDRRPDFAALRDGDPLGYVCMGNPDAEQWAFETLSRLIREYDADWIKLDFNLEPFAGCNRTDHGHGAGDGLYAHYRGYYRLLDQIRAAFPEVVLENCASGGLRIDLEMLRHTHLTFLSDPDWLTHDLQVFWGATTMLPADACLHWSASEWRSDSHPPEQTFNPRDPALTAAQLDSFTRAAMLGAFGMSQKLPDLPEWVAQRLATHIRVYKEHVRRFVRAADLYRLTDQPLRSGADDRWCAFQYRLPDGSESLVFVFRLAGSDSQRAIKLRDLAAERVYRITGFEGETYELLTGAALMARGLVLKLSEGELALIKMG